MKCSKHFKVAASFMGINVNCGSYLYAQTVKNYTAVYYIV